MMNGYTFRVRTYEMKHGIKMPPLGYGLFRLNNYNILYEAMDYALAEEENGPIIYNGAQMDRFIRGELPDPRLRPHFFNGHIVVHFQGVTRFIRLDCLTKPGSEHIDIYLIHFQDYIFNAYQRDPHPISYLAIAKIRDVSKVVGVPYFTMQHLKQFTDVMALGIMVEQYDQVEYLPHHVDSVLIQFCIKNNVLYHTHRYFSELSYKNNDLILDPILKAMTKRYRCSATEVLMSWALKNGLAGMAKSGRLTQMHRSIALNLELSKKDMKALNALGIFNKRNTWDPSNIA